MDETKIVNQLKQNIPSTTSPTEAPVSDSPQDTGYVSDIGDALDMYKLYDYFNVEPQFRTSTEEGKIQEIYRWAAQRVQSTDYLAVAKALMEIESQMGNGFSLTNRLQRMHEWVKLDTQISRLKQEQGWLYAQ